MRVRGGGTGAREAGINIRPPLKEKRLVTRSLRHRAGEFHTGPLTQQPCGNLRSSGNGLPVCAVTQILAPSHYTSKDL